MTVQWSTTLRNNLVTEWATTIGASPVLEIMAGTMPEEPADADSNTVLASFTLDETWTTTAADGSISMAAGGNAISSSNIYSTNASNAGTAAYYRIYPSGGPTDGGTNCCEQGTITATSGGGDMTLDNTSISADQIVQLTGYTKTAPGA